MELEENNVEWGVGVEGASEEEGALSGMASRVLDMERVLLVLE